MSLNAMDTASKTEEHVDIPEAAVPRAGNFPSWCIFVKTVGKGFDDRRVTDDGADDKKSGKMSSVDGSLSFHVTVSPEDRIDFLHDEIEGVTGVKASQQRLIYRGRLIGKSDVSSVSNSNTPSSTGSFNEKADQNGLTTCNDEHQQEYKIKDIVGLCDGQTIHLVRKRDCEKTKSSTCVSDDVNGQGASNHSSNSEYDDSGSNNSSSESESVGGGALLAALLGLDTRVPEDGGSTGIGLVSHGARTGVTNNNNRNGAQASTASTNRSLASPWRSSRAAANANSDGESTSARSPRHSRRPHYRLGTEDLEVPDPGSMESVRQGLMTLSTIMNSQPHQPSTIRRSGSVTCGNEGQLHTHHPLEVNREWFRGQWVDARDTVNQWLEATVVDILDSRDVLNDTLTLGDPTSSEVYARRYGSIDTHQPRQRRVPNVDNDPAISANDLEGRRRLLLEECEPGDPQEIIIGMDTESDQSSLQLPVLPGTSSTQSFRPRSTNDGVKLLLIHYNGWPHRWDEWIRSDSERLRPFRTRTRHPNTSSMASPTPHSIFNDAPRTNIIEEGNEEDDRLAVLPELNIALSRVSELLGGLMQRQRATEHNNQSRDNDEDELEALPPSDSRNVNNGNANYERVKSDLPWMARDAGEYRNNFDRDLNRTSSSGQDGASPSALPNLDESNEEAQAQNQATSGDIPSSDVDAQSLHGGRSHNVRSSYSQAELLNLSTLFDRLGRTLTDVAPHVASIAATLPALQAESNSSTTDEQNSLTITENPNSFDDEASSAPLGGLLSLWSRERERARRNNTGQENSTTRVITSTAQVDPDHLDFASGIVNTTRGEVRSGPRNRASPQDDVASLLGTYLASASLGSTATTNDDNGSGATSSLARLLQRGSGSGDNGIDIHIHAIVTAPGVSPGGMGIATLSSGSGSPTATLGGARNVFSNRNNVRVDGGILRSGTSLSSNVVEPTDEEDYSDLFSELYSESPTPIDPNSSPVREENETIITSSANRNSDDDDAENNRSPTRMSDNTEELESRGDASLVTPPSNRNRSSPRRQIRSGGVFRLFRRRGSRANNQDRSVEEDP